MPSEQARRQARERAAEIRRKAGGKGAWDLLRAAHAGRERACEAAFLPREPAHEGGFVPAVPGESVGYMLSLAGSPWVGCFQPDGLCVVDNRGRPFSAYDYMGGRLCEITKDIVVNSFRRWTRMPARPGLLFSMAGRVFLLAFVSASPLPRQAAAHGRYRGDSTMASAMAGNACCGQRPRWREYVRAEGP